jgi:hypothetical protein
LWVVMGDLEHSASEGVAQLAQSSLSRMSLVSTWGTIMHNDAVGTISEFWRGSCCDSPALVVVSLTEKCFMPSQGSNSLRGS